MSPLHTSRSAFGLSARVLLSLSLICLSALAAWPCDDHVGTCAIEAWRAAGPTARIITIEGVTTCDSGYVIIRVYETGSGEETFIGVADGLIQGHAFTAHAMEIDNEFQSLSIKYSIQPEP